MSVFIRIVHRLRNRHPWRFTPGYQRHGVTHAACLVCDPCELVVAFDLPPGHPESLTAELSDGQESLLTEIEYRLWPDRAEDEVTYSKDVCERIFPLGDLPTEEGPTP